MDKKLLPRGYASVIARKLKVSANQVYNVVYGISNNEAIKLELLNLIIEKQRLLTEIENRKGIIKELKAA